MNTHGTLPGRAMEILPVAKCKWSTSTQCWKWLAPSIASRAVAKIWKWFYDRASLAHMFSLSFTHTFFPLTPSPRAGLPSSKANYRAPSRRAFVSPDFTGITCRTSITWRLNEPTTTLEREGERSCESCMRERVCEDSAVEFYCHYALLRTDFQERSAQL